MKPALQFIWSPLLFAVLGFAIASKIADIAPREQYFTSQSIHFVKLTQVEFIYFALLALPAMGLVIGFFLAYLSTPTSRDAV